MAVVNGADSDAPQPSLYRGREVWGIYTPGWPRAALAELGQGGVRALMPITVAPVPKEGEPHWWSEDETGGYGVLEGLVREAMAWGVPSGSPLCLDVEEGLAEMMGAVGAKTVAKAWATACRIHGLIDWSYGGETWHGATEGLVRHRWLAKWPLESGQAPEEVPAIPEGFDALQYAGNVESGRIDLDLFNGALSYLGADLQVARGNEEPAADEPPEAPAKPAEPTPTQAQPHKVFSGETAAVESAVDAEIADVRTDQAAETAAAPSKREELKARITTLIEELFTHLSELGDLEKTDAPASESPK